MRCLQGCECAARVEAEKRPGAMIEVCDEYLHGAQIKIAPPPPEDLNLQELEMEGIKHDQDKPRMDLLPMDALVEVAKVLTFGSKKYGDRNWEKGLDPQRLRAAQLRHDAAAELGEFFDGESGLPHVAHKATDAIMELAIRIRATATQKADGFQKCCTTITNIRPVQG